MLRITQDRKKKRTLTGIELKSKNDWNSKRQEVRKTNPVIMSDVSILTILTFYSR